MIGQVLKKPVARAVIAGGVFLLVIGLFFIVRAALAQLTAQECFDKAGECLEKRQLKEARKHIRSCLAIWPNSADVHFRAARIERLLFHPTVAEKHLEQTKKLQGGANKKTQLEGLLLRALIGDFAAVEPGLWNYLAKKDDPDYDPKEATFVLEELARGYLNQNQWQLMWRCVNAWLMQEPENPKALEWRAWVNSQLGNMASARRDYFKMSQVAPERWKGRLQYSEMLLHNNQIEEAERQLLAVRSGHEDKRLVLLGLARVRFGQNRLAKARKFFDRLHKKYPKDADGAYYRAQLELQDGKPTIAEKWCRKAIENNYGHFQAHFLLHQCLNLQPGREKEARAELHLQKQLEATSMELRELQRNLEGAKANAESFYRIGKLYLRLKNDKEGEKWLKLALGKDRKHQPTHSLLAEFYEARKQPRLAANHRRAVEK